MFDPVKAYAYHGRTRGEPNDDNFMRINVLYTYPQRIDYRPPYDHDSIMHYPMSEDILLPRTLDGVQVLESGDVDENTELSEGDKLTIAYIYLKPKGYRCTELSLDRNRCGYITLNLPQTGNPRVVVGLSSFRWTPSSGEANPALEADNISGGSFRLTSEVLGLKGHAETRVLVTDPLVFFSYAPLDDHDLNTVRELARLELDEHTHTHTQTEHIELEWASKPITEPLQVCKHVPTTIGCPVVIIWINKFKVKAGHKSGCIRFNSPGSCSSSPFTGLQRLLAASTR